MSRKKFPSDNMQAEVKKKWRLFRKEHKKEVPKPEPEPEPTIEEIEEVIKEAIEKTPLMEKFEEETGKKAIWGGKITKGFLKWKEECDC